MGVSTSLTSLWLLMLALIFNTINFDFSITIDLLKEPISSQCLMKTWTILSVILFSDRECLLIFALLIFGTLGYKGGTYFSTLFSLMRDDMDVSEQGL